MRRSVSGIVPTGSHDLAAGTLLHSGGIEGPEIALWALCPSRRLLGARVSAFLDIRYSMFVTC
jgi:hypothetical protein